MNEVKKHSRIKKFCRVAFLCAAAVLVGVLIFSAAINIFMTSRYKDLISDPSDIGNMENAEYAIVLGCAVYKNGEPCDMLRHRLDIGAELYLTGKVEKIIVSGNPSESHNNEPLAMKEYLIKKEVPQDDIFVDNGGISTYDTMSRAAHLFGVKSAIVVSQKYHLSRAMYIGEQNGISVSGASATFGKYDDQLKYSVREYLARCKDFFMVLFNLSYNGTEVSLPSPDTQPSPIPEPTPTPDDLPTVEPTPEPEPEPEPKAETVDGIVIPDTLNVHQGAGSKHTKIGELQKGDLVTIVGTSGGWHRIQYNGGEGYVSTDYIELKYTVDASKHVIYEGAVNDLFPIAKSYSLPRTSVPEYVMLHFSSAIMIDFDDPYNIDLVRDIFIDGGVDAHYIIDRDGTIYCYVPEDRVAYHAGSMNQLAIGIEILAIGSKSDMSIYMSGSKYDKIDPSLIGYTDAQYEALGELVSDICERYDIPTDREHIVGHDEYNANKNDPGELFDWDKMIDILNP